MQTGANRFSSGSGAVQTGATGSQAGALVRCAPEPHLLRSARPVRFSRPLCLLLAKVLTYTFTVLDVVRTTGRVKQLVHIYVYV